MDIEIKPRLLKGSLQAPSSKSDAHRVLIAAALSTEPTEISLFCQSEDIQATVGCLEACGARLTQLDDAQTRYLMEPLGTQSAPPEPILNCGESGTTLRLLIPVVAALGIAATFTAHGRLPERPLCELIRALEDNGARFRASKPAEGKGSSNSIRPPFRLEGSLNSGEYRLPGNISSQYISGLLFALPLVEGTSRITLTTSLESAAYVEMTLSTLKDFGISIEKVGEHGYSVEGKQSFTSPGSATVEGDWSNAAFFLAAGALGGSVEVSGLLPTSLQADRAISEILKSFGANVQTGSRGVSASAESLQARDIDVSGFPDLFPILAVVAAGAQGNTRLFNAARLRMKESDRIAAVAAMLSSLGADVEEFPDALVIHGKSSLFGGIVEGAFDHRIVMAAAMASILCKNPVTILGAEVVAKSYPHFFDDFNAMGGNAYVVNAG